MTKSTFHAKTRGGQRAHKVLVALEIPFRSRRPHLVVADATVNQNDMMRRAHDIGLETEDQPVILTKGFRRKPAAILLEHFRRESGKHVKRRQKRPLQLNDAMNADVADALGFVHRNSRADLRLPMPSAGHINKNSFRLATPRAKNAHHRGHLGHAAMPRNRHLSPFRIGVSTFS